MAECTFFVLRGLGADSWAEPLAELEQALAQRDRKVALDAYGRLYHTLLESGASSLADAAIRDLLALETPFSRLAMQAKVIPEGLKAGMRFDLRRLGDLLRRDWQAEASGLLGRDLPPLDALALEGSASQAIELDDGEMALAVLQDHYRRHGAGLLSRFEAFRWEGGELLGIAFPEKPDASRLIGPERQLERLQRNTEAFLARLPAQHALLYGPRGSGKSTAIRSLLPRYAKEGLRLIELHPQDLTDLLVVMELLRGQPHRYGLFVDDLSFEEGDRGYAPLKTLLEGSLTERPENVLVYATSNRRHLVRESFSDRPDPLSDDVHGWDTVNERLALADRFGLTITFPSATQAQYLDIVRGLAARAGLDGDDLEGRALKFAGWGNGFSGRTAQQFIDSLKMEPG
jgi:uncharacterized protein